MYLLREHWEKLEGRLGRPEILRHRAEFKVPEFGLLEYCRRKDRAHDLTLLIRGADGRLALIRKPGYPPEVFRPPGGGAEPGEEIEDAAAREAWEETGLVVRLERYLLRVDAHFTCEGAGLDWTTHVFAAEAVGGELDPQDRREIEEARWATQEEIETRYRPAMLAWGSAGMRYRVELQDAALRRWNPESRT